jgi:hypothetical protein
MMTLFPRRRALRRIASVALVVALAAAAAAAEGKYTLEEARSIVKPDVRPTKILVVAIADDREIRNRFEDKFVTHLRGRGIMAIASHPIVPSLTKMEDREKVLAAVEKEGVDGVMTVRAASLDELGPERWASDWHAWLESDSTIRALIERSLPLPAKKAKRYGIEFTLWRSGGDKLWAARSGACTRKDLQSGVAELLQLAIDALKDDHWV